MTSLDYQAMSSTAAATSSSRADPTDLEMVWIRVAALYTRLTHWEFWPSWLIYLPLVPYILFLAVRHRGLRTCTHANPGIPNGGIVGESKGDILNLLPYGWIQPTALIQPGPVATRLSHLQEAIRNGRWSWPIVLKPDVGQRGDGVKVISNLDEAQDYLDATPRAVLAQRFHPGPFEVGVFYYRFPGEPKGRIFSITEKQFAAVTGDGRSSLRALIWRHPRYRVQADSFLSALAERAEYVPDAKESVPVGSIGNHCRGAMFLDGAHLITPQLQATFDAIAVQTKGFYFGRFDVRFADPLEFAEGRGFSILELNGLLSESTNIYDPRTSYWQAQRVLRRQWSVAFQIGSRLKP